MEKVKNTAYHVVFRGGDNWAVRKSTTPRASKIFKTQAEAIVFGTLASKNQNVPLYIHNLNGTVARKITIELPEAATICKSKENRILNDKFKYAY